MTRTHIDFRPARLAALSLVGALGAGCSSDAPAPAAEPQTSSSEADATSIFPPNPDACNPPGYGIPNFPFVQRQPDILGEILPRPTELGETTALHVRLPPPHNQELTNSLVRVIGSPDRPQILFRSDALAQIGVIAKSPGSDFFTAFSTMPPSELDRLLDGQKQIESGAFGKTTQESLVFAGRAVAARTINASFPSVLRPGSPFTLAGCPLRPVSEQAAWDKALFIRDPAVILNAARTWDPCTGAGTRGGVWTFAHLMREMAIGSGLSAESFVLNWLTNWLNNYTVNGDTVVARTLMFNQVIQPWATASGVVATLVVLPNGQLGVTLSRPLNLDIAPFRLVSIVNRIDLGKTAHGGGHYGSTTDRPVTAGELRFIFDVVQPNPWGGAADDQTCGKKLFSTIFEYGVPGVGCDRVVQWAQQWTSLQAQPGFTPAYLAQLESMTESVVKHGSAPGRGNDNAINQVRTNEVALTTSRIWELREFTLNDEAGNPLNGPLRTHTVAQTPDDGAFFSSTGANATVNAFINTVVTPSTPFFTSNPNNCSANYDVPLSFLGRPFKGGNALIPPSHWENNTAGATARSICGRHQFSFNTCQGCHRDDTCNVGPVSPFVNTSFTQVNLTDPIPVRMSKFLTGGGPGLTFNVPDTQGLPIPNAPFAWPFADLHRRLERLFDIAFCTSCLQIILPDPVIIRQFPVVPFDINPGDPPPDFKIGPITDLSFVKQLIDLRPKFKGELTNEPADVIRDFDPSVH